MDGSTTLTLPQLFITLIFALLALGLSLVLWRHRQSLVQNMSMGAEIGSLKSNLEGLLLISEASASIKDTQGFYEKMLDVILSVTGFSQAGIHIYDEKKNQVFVVACRGWTPGMLQESGVMSQEVFGPLQVVKDTKKVVAISDIRSTSHYIHKSGLDAGFISLAEVPLLAGEQFMGMISIATKMYHEWTEAEVRWLETVGRQVGVAIFRAQLTDQMRDLATLQERERISQEIHDELSQMIGSLALMAQKVSACLDARDLATVKQGIAEIEKTARDAYGSVREEILSLREFDERQEDLVQIIQSYLQRFERQWHICTHLEIDGAGLDFSAGFPVEIQLLRILKEAMTNIRRHARAADAWVRLHSDRHFLHVEIEDNGCGFDLQAMAQGHFGLRIMKERAESVRGSVQVDSVPGMGTRIHIELPRLPEGRLSGELRPA